MLNYLVTSKGRRTLLRLLWAEGESGSVSELARLAGLSFRSAHRELNQMHRAGLAVCTRAGNATMFEADKDHPAAKVLLALVREQPPRNAGATSRFDPQADAVRATLGAWGAPLPAAGAPATLPNLEKALAQGAKLAHSDASVTRALPVCIWKHRHRLDWVRLRGEAQRLGEAHALGFFVALTGALGSDPALVDAAENLRDGRRRRDRNFFQGRESALARRLAEERAPEVAKRWLYRMNMGLDTFAATFRKFTPDAAV